MNDCPNCGSELIVFKIWGSPNWEWCQNCDAVYDDHGENQGTRKDLEENEQHLIE